MKYAGKALTGVREYRFESYPFLEVDIGVRFESGFKMVKP